MKGKVRRKLMWMQLSILIAVTGGGALIYYLAAPFYHSFQRNQLIWEAYILECCKSALEVIS